MRLLIAAIAAAAALLPSAASAGPQEPQAQSRLTPAEIQDTFFNGTEFAAATPAGVKFKMTFSADGKVMRVPAGHGGKKSQGIWKLDDNGYCTTWKGSKPGCFTVVATDSNKWSVMKGPAVIATWSR